MASYIEYFENINVTVDDVRKSLANDFDINSITPINKKYLIKFRENYYWHEFVTYYRSKIHFSKKLYNFFEKCNTTRVYVGNLSLDKCSFTIINSYFTTKIIDEKIDGDHPMVTDFYFFLDDLKDVLTFKLLF